MIEVYKKNLIFLFVKNIFLVTAFFFCLTLIMNVLEEITFFKNSNVSFTLPMLLTFFNSFSIIFEIFPFIFLIGTMSFFLKSYTKKN